MKKVSEENLKIITNHLEYLGYEFDCLRHVELVEDKGIVKVLDYPTSDHYNGIPESLLKIFIRDIDESIRVCNEEKGNDE